MQALFDLDRFVDDCRARLGADTTRAEVREVVARAIAHPGAIGRALGEPQRAQLRPLHRSRDLTVLQVILAPDMIVPPHDHRMWAVIGVYSGREENIYWHRVPRTCTGELEAVGARTWHEHAAGVLDADVIHSVINPLGRMTAALHVYGGDFFATPRSEWDPHTLLEKPFDAQRAMQRFDAANPGVFADANFRFD
jgi:predicted metal-dependent enzyme (double-stranded beta helix superfamily)